MDEADWGRWRLRASKRELLLLGADGAPLAVVPVEGFTSARRIDEFVALLRASYADDGAPDNADFAALRRALVDAALRDIRPDDKVVGA